MTDLADIWPDNYVRRPQRALPVALILDVSAHIPVPRAAELRNGIIQLDQFLQQNQELRHCIDLTLIAPRCIMAEVQLEVIRCEPTHALDPASKVSLPSILNCVLDDFEKRYADQMTVSPETSSHWLILLSEGGKDSDISWGRRVDEQVKDGRLTIIPVIVGEGCESALLLAMGPDRPPLRLQRGGGLRFFSWLANELQRVVTAKPGKRVYLDIAGMAAWART